MCLANTIMCSMKFIRSLTQQNARILSTLTHMTEELPLKSRSAGTTVAVFMPPAIGYAAASEALRRAIEHARAEGMTRIQVHRGNEATEQAARELGFQRHEDYLSLLLLEDTLATEHCTISEFEFLRFKFELKQFYEEVRLLCGRNGAMLGPEHTVYIARDEGRNLVCGVAYVDKKNHKGVWSIDVLCSSVRGMDKVLFDHMRRAAHADNIVLTILPNNPLDEEERALYKSWGTHRISSKGYVMFPRPKRIIDTKNQHGFPLPPFVIRADSVDGAFLRRLVLDKYPDTTTITVHFWGAGTPPAEVVDGTMYNTARMDYIKIGVPTMIKGPTLRRQNAERDLVFLRKERSEWEHRHDFWGKLEAYEEQLAYEKSIGDKGFGPEFREFERKFQELDRAHTELTAKIQAQEGEVARLQTLEDRLRGTAEYFGGSRVTKNAKKTKTKKTTRSRTKKSQTTKSRTKKPRTKTSHKKAQKRSQKKRLR